MHKMNFTPHGGHVRVAISCELLVPENAVRIRKRVEKTLKALVTLVLCYILVTQQSEGKVVGSICVALVDSSGAGLSEFQQGRTFGKFTQFNRNELQN